VAKLTYNLQSQKATLKLNNKQTVSGKDVALQAVWKQEVRRPARRCPRAAACA
jgi:hypothetical protein